MFRMIVLNQYDAPVYSETFENYGDLRWALRDDVSNWIEPGDTIQIRPVEEKD